MTIRPTKNVRRVIYYGHEITAIVERITNTINGGPRYDITIVTVDGAPCGVTVRTGANYSAIDDIVIACANYAGVF